MARKKAWASALSAQVSRMISWQPWSRASALAASSSARAWPCRRWAGSVADLVDGEPPARGREGVGRAVAERAEGVGARRVAGEEDGDGGVRRAHRRNGRGRLPGPGVARNVSGWCAACQSCTWALSRTRRRGRRPSRASLLLERVPFVLDFRQGGLRRFAPPAPPARGCRRCARSGRRRARPSPADAPAPAPRAWSVRRPAPRRWSGGRLR